MIDSPPVQPADAAAPAIPGDLRAVLDVAMVEGDQATVEKVFGYALRARPDAAQAIEALRQDYRAKLIASRELKQAETNERLARSDPFVNWSGQVEFGGSLTTGAVSSLGLLGAVDAERKGIDWSHKLAIRGELQDTNGSRSVERLTASWQPRYAVSHRTYVFGLTQYEHDPGLGYDNRYSAGIGAGVKLSTPDGIKIGLEGGPAFRQTDTGDTQRSALAGRASADLNWPLNPRMTLEQKASAYYEDGFANGLFASSLSTRVSEKVKLKLSYEYRYESERTHASTGSTTRASLVFGL